MLTPLSRWAGAPVAVLLGLQVVGFVTLSGRGLDFTDEAFYLLSYQHGRGIAATTTFYGVFFEWPFRLLGGDVGAMRVFGLALLAGTGGHLAWRVFVFAQPSGAQVSWPYLAAAVAGSLLYYIHLATLRAPSYNLLVLACIQLATALLLTLADEPASATRWRWLAFSYGLVLGVCALTKAPSALALAACHLAFLLCFVPVRRVPGHAALVLMGAAIVALGLAWVHPGWPDSLRAGVAVAIALDTGFGALPSLSMRTALALGAALLAVAACGGRLHRGLPSWLLSALAVVTVAVVLIPFEWQAAAKMWWVLMSAGTALMWLIATRCAPAAPALEPGAPRRIVGLSLLLLLMPWCYSIGTNGSLAAHSRMAAGMALLALLLPLHRLQGLGLIRPAALATALALPSLPLLGGQWNALTDPAATYRLGTGLAAQQQPTTLGRERRILRLDAATQAGVLALTRQMSEAGYTPGTPILDMTGDGPGLVYALGGRPLGAVWLLGGYPGSERSAAMALARVPANELRSAWVISADDNPRALRRWPELLRTSAGDTGIEAIGSVDWLPQTPSADGTRTPVRLTLWKPPR